MIHSLLSLLKRRWYLAIAGIALITLSLITLLPPTIIVTTAITDRGDVRATIVDEARTRMRETYTISAPFAGQLKRIQVEVGDAVKQGANLIWLSRGSPGFMDLRADQAARAAVLAAQARYRAAALRHKQAEYEYERVLSLAKEQLVARSSLDDARTDLETAQAEVDMSAAELARAKAVLLPATAKNQPMEVELKSPVAGVVLQLWQKSETVVPAGTPLITLGDPNDIDIAAEYLSQEAVNIRVGYDALIENWSSDTDRKSPLAAKVERIEPIASTKVSALGIEEQRARVILRLTQSPPETLRAHDYRVDARIVIRKASDVTRAPIGSLFRRRDSWYVFVIENDRAWLRWVEPGLKDDRHVEIRRGLTPGEQVVVYPPRSLSHGAKIAEQQQPR